MTEAPSQAAPPPALTSPVSSGPSPMRRTLRISLFIIVFGVLLGAGFARFGHEISGASVRTNDAFIRADVTPIAARIDGTVKAVLVGDHQAVRAGDVLIEIDDRDYAARRDQARADLAASRAGLEVIDQQLAQQRAVVEAASAALKLSEADAWRADRERDRQETLLRSRYGSEQAADRAIADARKAQAQVLKDQAGLATQNAQVPLLAAQRIRQEADIAGREAALALAELNLSYAKVRAPADGVINERQARVGQYIRPGAQLMAHVTRPGLWVNANFKETQLAHMRAGDSATLNVDMLPEAPLQGRVESLAPGTGAQFALLPPDNATGNFTKIVQRMPVRIAIEGAQDILTRLAPGHSVSVEVDVSRNAPNSFVRRMHDAFMALIDPSVPVTGRATTRPGPPNPGHGRVASGSGPQR
jgi:membrane fusion protein, multidrug efflux system